MSCDRRAEIAIGTREAGQGGGRGGNASVIVQKKKDSRILNVKTHKNLFYVIIRPCDDTPRVAYFSTTCIFKFSFSLVIFFVLPPFFFSLFLPYVLAFERYKVISTIFVKLQKKRKEKDFVQDFQCDNRSWRFEIRAER